MKTPRNAFVANTTTNNLTNYFEEGIENSQLQSLAVNLGWEGKNDYAVCLIVGNN